MAGRQTKRKALSKKKRFEVFKRDGFRCQYCGAVSPDVLLQVDHIKPVKGGGTDDLTNLITACGDCNAGKADRPLDDKSVVEKQRQQLEELNERRLQLEMMMRWRDELARLEDSKLEYARQKFEGLSKFRVTEVGAACLKKLLRQYGFDEVMTAIEISCNQYLVLGNNGKHYQIPSVDKAFDYIGRICASRKREKTKPYLRELYYIRGILNRRLYYVNPHVCMDYLERAYLADASLDSLKSFAKTVSNWSQFRDAMEDYLSEHEKGITSKPLE